MNASGFFSVALGLALAATQGAEAAPASMQTLADKQAITELVYCYARGADTIGNGSLGDQAEARGLAIFEQCFAEDATFAVWPAGMPFNRLEFPDRSGDMPPALLIEGRAAWASMVNTAFRSAGGVGYDFVQHNLSNLRIDIDGDRATLTTYLSSVHVIHGAPGEPIRCRQQANGTYSMQASKQDGNWMIVSLDLAQIANDIIVENGAGCAAPSP